jgi:hypothetical protein
MFGSRTGPALISKMLPVPTSGLAGYAVRTGSTVLLSMAVKALTGSKQNGDRVMAGGMFGSRTGPALISKMMPVPTSGLAGYAVRTGSTVLLSMAVKALTGSKQNGDRVMAGGLGAIVYDLFNEYLAPMVGLSGYEGGQSIVIPADIQEALEGYTIDRPGVGRYIDQAEAAATVY